MLTFVPLRSLQSLREAVGERDYIRGMGDAAAMFGQLSGGECWDVIVIDPDLCRQGECEQFLHEARKCQAAVMLNSDLSGAGPFAAMVEGVSAVVLRDHGDGVSELRQVLDGLPTPSLELRLLQRLAWRFDALPSATRRAAFALFLPLPSDPIDEAPGWGKRHRSPFARPVDDASGVQAGEVAGGGRTTRWRLRIAREHRRLLARRGLPARVRIRSDPQPPGAVSHRAWSRLLALRLPDHELLERLEASVLDSRKTRVVQPLLLPSPLDLAPAHWDGD